MKTEEEHASVDVTKPGSAVSRTPALLHVDRFGGATLLSHHWLNRGTNFSLEERKQKNLEGLLPPAVESLSLQAERVMEQLSAPNLLPLNKYNILKEIFALNQTLFYKILIDNLADLLPIVYTPTVGEACRRFDLIYREPMGMYLSAFSNRNRFAELLQHWPSRSVQIIVVTDGSRILGLGDLGTNGMGIPVGKIALFVAAGGFHPEHSLPLTLDVGTNNQELLKDKFYMGERQQRLTGDDYWSAIDELCDAVKQLWPHALLQFEDFETSKAFAILDRRRHRQLCFNDDIQGTGAVVLAGIINGLKMQKTAPKDARIVFYGAGSSAVGVAEAIAGYLEQKVPLSREQARKSIFMVDSKGLVYSSRGDELPEHKKVFAVDDEDLQKLLISGGGVQQNKASLKDLKAVIAAVKPHVLVGLSAAGPSWPQEVIEELCSHVKRPLIFPLSNPTDRAEITAKEAYTFSKGAAIFAAGSPFDPVELPTSSSSSSSSSEGVTVKQKNTYVPGQANNVFIFPGVGFGAVMAKAASVSDGMFTAAAEALAHGCVSEDELRAGQIYPSMGTLRETCATVAAAVAEAAWKEGLSGLGEVPHEGWKKYIEGKMWWPRDGKDSDEDDGEEE